jgi:hypothetical protein
MEVIQNVVYSIVCQSQEKERWGQGYSHLEPRYLDSVAGETLQHSAWILIITVTIHRRSKSVLPLYFPDNQTQQSYNISLSDVI